MSQKICFGADMGGTTIKIGYFTTEGELLEKWEIKTRKENNGAYILEDLAASILNKMREKKISSDNVIGIGLGVPGPVLDDGTVNICVNVGWGVFNVEKKLSELTGLKTRVNNDANVAALGEMWQGGGKGFQSIVMITLGTGVGGGLIINGEIVSGSNGAAGEIGHMTMNPREKDICNCGKHGCLEQYASATGIVRVARQHARLYHGSSLLKEKPIFSAKDVLDAAKTEDPLACEIMDEVCGYLGLALANVSAVADPEAFCIGGGVSKAGEYLINMIEKYYGKYAFHASRNTVFKLATLGNNAGIYGSAKMMLGK